MATALERLEELEKQLQATQLSHVELEMRVALLDAVVSHLVTTRMMPSQQQLAALTAEVAKRIGEKYPGLHIELRRMEENHVLFVPNGTAAKLPGGGLP